MTSEKTLMLIGATAILVACGGRSDKDKANQLLNEATQQMESKEYSKALLTIDSLRKTYPKDVEARRLALSLYQQVSLRQAQEDLANTDSLMEIVSDEYNQLKAKVERDRSELKASFEDTEKLNLTKAKMDSLKVRFDMQCAKIKYIHKKQKE